MGAGIGAILTYILREHYEFLSCSCLAFAPRKWNLKLSVLLIVESVIWKFSLFIFFCNAKLLCWHLEILSGLPFGFSVWSWLVGHFKSLLLTFLCLNVGKVGHYTRFIHASYFLENLFPEFASINHDFNAEDIIKTSKQFHCWMQS